MTQRVGTAETGTKPVVTVRRGGVPTDTEVAAIIAAIEATWPQPASGDGDGERPLRWRFSGRWWSKPMLARRERPF